MTASSTIIELRELLAAKYPAIPSRGGGHLPTGLERVDAVLGGGLPHGGTVEIVCQGASGGLLLAALLRSTQERRSLMALIDGADSFDFAGLPKAALSRLLWVRGRLAAQAVQAADLLLRDGNLALVVMDLRSNDAREVAKVPASNWHRLQRVVEPSTTAFLALTRQPLVSAARPRLRLEARFTLDACAHRQSELMATLNVSFVRGAEERVRQYA